MTTILTGRSLALTIDGDTYTAQCSSASLVPTNNTETFQTLAGPVARRISESWELQVRGWQDWNAVGGMAAALWAAAAANTPVAFTLTVDGDAAFTGNVIPVYPTVGGDASSALEVDVTFPVDGTPTFTP